ncbi:MAG: GDSL-type esterase/lipase family protein [Nitrospiraceae bacterium]
MSRVRNLLLGGALSVVSVGISLAVLEMAMGYLYEHAPYANGKRTVERYIGNPMSSLMFASSSTTTLRPHPYLLYDNFPNMQADGFRQTNSLGYRNEEFPLEKPAGTIRILCLGGSTTYMWPYMKNPKDTWVARLEVKLQAISSKRVQVINAGLNYGTSAEALAGYVFRHRFLRPDLIVYHGGGNDVLPLIFDGYSPEYTHFRGHGNGVEPRPGERTLLAKSNIGKYLYARWLQPVGTVVTTKPFWEVSPQDAFERVKRTDPEGFRRNVDYLAVLGKEGGAQVVLFGFLQARKENLTKNANAFKGFEDTLVLGLQKNYEVMRTAAQKHGIPFIIPEQDKFKDEWFLDNCHLTREGEEMKAQILFDELKHNPIFRNPVPL